MASRQEEKERLRKERQAQEADAAAKKAKQATARKFALIGGGVLILVAIVVGVVVGGSGGDSKTSDSADVSELEFVSGPVPTKAIATTDGSEKDLLAAAKTAGCTVNKNPNEGHEHEDPSTDFKYDANPPTSGNHTPTWAEDGAYPSDTYTTPYLVHGLEHGRVEYLWDPDKVTKQQLGSLKKLYDADPYHLILHPTTSGMPDAIAAAAWDYSLTCPKMNNDVFTALRLFKLNHIDQGREQVP